jgi:hypothetical protein
MDALFTHPTLRVPILRQLFWLFTSLLLSLMGQIAWGTADPVVWSGLNMRITYTTEHSSERVHTRDIITGMLRLERLTTTVAVVLSKRGRAARRAA